MEGWAPQGPNKRMRSEERTRGAAGKVSGSYRGWPRLAWKASERDDILDRSRSSGTTIGSGQASLDRRCDARGHVRSARPRPAVGLNLAGGLASHQGAGIPVEASTCLGEVG
jgi:hypothetical protein